MTASPYTAAEALRAVGAGHEPDWKALAMQMFYPLQSSPCRCSHRWEKGVITRVNHCSRCVASACVCGCCGGFGMNAALIPDRESQIDAALAAMIAAFEAGEAVEAYEHWKRMRGLIAQRTLDEVRALEMARFGRAFK